MKKHSIAVFLPIFIIILLWFVGAPSDLPNRLNSEYVEDFDGAVLSTIGHAIVDHPLVSKAEDAGIDGSHAIKVSYVGYERGSRRVVVSPWIHPASQYTLSFWVQFCEGFDFARGGKLHGVGPASPVAGGNAITPDGWSARLMFRRDGGLQTYVYHQDMAGRFGDTDRASGFSFEPGRFHHIVMRVRLNAPASARNGSIDVWVDDKLVIQHDGLRFRDRVAPESDIQRLLFSTFHGGSSPEWAPRNDDGSYKTDCAFFDSITVTSST